jgi:hypothetical protein
MGQFDSPMAGGFPLESRYYNGALEVNIFEQRSTELNEPETILPFVEKKPLPLPTGRSGCE